MWRVWVCVVALSVAATGGEHNVPASHRREEHYLSLAFDLEVLLEQHLQNWRFLTETPSTLDVGGIFNRRWLDPQRETQTLMRSRGVGQFGRGAADLAIWLPSASHPVCEDVPCTEGAPGDDRIRVTQETDHKIHHHNMSEGDGLPVQANVTNSEANHFNFTFDHGDPLGAGPGRDDGDGGGGGADLGDARGTRGRRSSNIPVMYMPGSKTKRKCVAVNGIFSGYNTFSYLSFITGLLSLVLNVNNNINNNNNNNNLNDNNAISNNNVDANINSNTANQVVVFPPGRKRRSVADVILQLLATRSTSQDQTVRRGAQAPRSFDRDMVVAVTATLRLLAAAATDGLAASLGAAGVSPDWGASLCPATLALATRGGPGAHIAAAFRAVSRRWVVEGSGDGGLGCRRRRRARSGGVGRGSDMP